MAGRWWAGALGREASIRVLAASVKNFCGGLAQRGMGRASGRGGGRDDGGERFFVVPRHPASGGGGQSGHVTLKFGQIIERICSAQLARVDQTHENVSDVRAVAGLVEQGILPVQDRPLQRAFTDVVVCALTRHIESSGVNPDRRCSSQPEALGAVQEVTNGLKHFKKRLLKGVSRPCGLQRAVNTEQAPKAAMRKPTRHNNGEGRCHRIRDEKCLLWFRRGSGGSTHGRDSMCNKGSLPGRPPGQRRTREGQRRPRQMADGSVVPWKPRNGGGGKGPWFRTNA